MKNLHAFCLAPLALVAAPASANVVNLTGTVPAFGVSYIFFTYTGGGISIGTTGISSGPSGSALLDPEISLFVDDGSSIGALTGAFVANDDDTFGSDPLIAITDLVAGNYVLAVGSFDLTESEARSGIATTPDVASDYATDFSAFGTVTINGAGAVPEPATWAMMIGGFGMVGGAMRRRQATKASISFA